MYIHVYIWGSRAWETKSHQCYIHVLCYISCITTSWFWQQWKLVNHTLQLHYVLQSGLPSCTGSFPHLLLTAVLSHSSWLIHVHVFIQELHISISDSRLHGQFIPTSHWLYMYISGKKAKWKRPYTLLWPAGLRVCVRMIAWFVMHNLLHVHAVLLTQCLESEVE